MNQTKIREVLVEHGRRLFNAKRSFVKFTGDQEADELLNDLQRFPHAFVIACVMDRQMPAERAWLIPYRFLQKVGDFTFSRLVDLSLHRIQDLMTNPEPLHRFPDKMSNNFHQAIITINKNYGGDASKIWRGTLSSAEVVYRFLQFRGVGPKIATMAVNILARDFKIPLSDYYSIDVSADVHIRRVFRRLGLVTKKASIEEIVYKARALNPEFPGLMDFPVWEIGRNWCKSQQPTCKDCYMKKLCPTSRDS